MTSSVLRNCKVTGFVPVLLKFITCLFYIHGMIKAFILLLIVIGCTIWWTKFCSKVWGVILHNRKGTKVNFIYIFCTWHLLWYLTVTAIPSFMVFTLVFPSCNTSITFGRYHFLFTLNIIHRSTLCKPLKISKIIITSYSLITTRHKLTSSWTYHLIFRMVWPRNIVLYVWRFKPVCRFCGVILFNFFVFDFIEVCKRLKIPEIVGLVISLAALWGIIMFCCFGVLLSLCSFVCKNEIVVFFKSVVQWRRCIGQNGREIRPVLRRIIHPVIRHSGANHPTSIARLFTPLTLASVVLRQQPLVRQFFSISRHEILAFVFFLAVLCHKTTNSLFGFPHW